MAIANLDSPPQDKTANYATSKTGNWFLASELAREVGRTSIISVAQNPGNLKTNLLRHAQWMKYASFPLLYKPRMGAYTELWAGLSPEVTFEMNGGYVVPWGRPHPSPRKDLLDALKTKQEGGTGQAAEFRKWVEKQTARYIQ